MIFQKSQYQEGQVILIDKPLEWTSFDVVGKLRNFLKIKKIGHAGTLDPLATGLLILCTGRKTKQIEGYQGLKKSYSGTMVIGKTTPSYDLETEIEESGDISHLSEKDIFEAAKLFSGKIQQKPPTFSAIKKDGVRSYHLARNGKEVKLDAREVEIFEFKITNISLPEISFDLTCSKGFYVRSLVRDFGNALKVGAYMSGLRRTSIGDFSVQDALTVHEFIEGVNKLEQNEDIS